MSNTEQRLARFLSKRRTLRGKSLGASEVAAVLGRSPFQTPFEVFAYHVLGQERDLSGNDAVQLGHMFERPVMEYYARTSDRIVEPNDEIYPHRSAPLHATPDGFVWRDQGEAGFDDGQGVYEGKNTGIHYADQWEHDAPIHYQIQHQVQMECAARSWGVVVACVGGQRLVAHEYSVHPQAIGQILLYITSWWEQHIVRQQPPPIDGSQAAADYLADNYEDCGHAIELPCETAALLDKYEAAKARIAEAAAEKRELANALKSLLGDARYGQILGDGRVLSWKESHVREHVVPTRTTRVFRALARVPRGVKFETSINWDEQFGGKHETE